MVFFAEISFVSKKISIFAIEMQLFTTLINRGPLMGLLENYNSEILNTRIKEQWNAFDRATCAVLPDMMFFDFLYSTLN